MGCLVPDELYGVIGWPLNQTLSPLIHNTAFRDLGLPATYLAWPLAAQDLRNFVQTLHLFKVRGLSVTIPHKVEIMAYLDNLSESAALAGAVNTLAWRNGALYGDNTDVDGFLEPLRHILTKSMSVLLLGAGGAARAAAAGLRLSGCQNVRVTSPGNIHQYELAERFAFMGIPWERRHEHAANLVINSTPLGMRGKLENQTPYDFAQAPPVNDGWAYDLVYNPHMTLFLEQAALAGRKPITGLEMFFGQGNAQFRLWFGRDLPPASREALERALEKKA